MAAKLTSKVDLSPFFSLERGLLTALPLILPSRNLSA